MKGVKRGHKGRLIRPETPELIASALERFRRFCVFEPETGCVVWIGGKTQGRGHHVPYGSFWFNGDNWLAHRWAGRFIHGLDIEGYDVDHCCPNIIRPNTLCVEHLQPLTPRENREKQTVDTRRTFIHLQVGLVTHHDVYGYSPDDPPVDWLIPQYDPPAWLGITEGPTHGHQCDDALSAVPF